MKMMRVFAFISLLGLAFLSANVWAAENNQSVQQSLGREYTFGQIVGTVVKNDQGQELGRISDIVLDSHDRIPFVIISHGGVFGMGGKQVAVPMSALNYNTQGKYLALNMDQAKFNAAPNFTLNDLSNPQWASQEYRYFGQQPYWTESGTGNELPSNQPSEQAPIH